MRSNRNVALLAVAAGVIGYSLLRKGTGIASLNFLPAGIKNFSFVGTALEMTAAVTVQNTSNQDFTLKSIAGNIYSDNYFVGNVNYFTPQLVKANSQSTLYLNARLELTGLVNDIMRAYENKNFKKSLTIKGSANVDNLQIPLLLTFNVGI